MCSQNLNSNLFRKSFEIYVLIQRAIFVKTLTNRNTNTLPRLYQENSFTFTKINKKIHEEKNQKEILD